MRLADVIGLDILSAETTDGRTVLGHFLTAYLGCREEKVDRELLSEFFVAMFSADDWAQNESGDWISAKADYAYISDPNGNIEYESQLVPLDQYVPWDCSVDEDEYEEVSHG